MHAASVTSKKAKHANTPGYCANLLFDSIGATDIEEDAAKDSIPSRDDHGAPPARPGLERESKNYRHRQIDRGFESE